jgi:hypothetical protein
MRDVTRSFARRSALVRARRGEARRAAARARVARRLSRTSRARARNEAREATYRVREAGEE